MSEKNGLQSILTGALLVMVGMAFGAIFVKVGEAQKPTEAAAPEAASAAQVAEVAQTVNNAAQDAVLVYLCHGNVRCPTCVKIESSTKDVLEQMFADEIRSGRVIVKEINYEQPQNRDMLTKYQIIAPTVIMVQLKDGKETTYRNIMEVWQTIHEPAAFQALISGNLRDLLPETSS